MNIGDKIYLFRNEKFLIFFFLFFSSLVYFNSLIIPFIFDDNHMVVNNVFIRNFQYVYKFFTGYITSTTPENMTRPFLMATFIFNYRVSKLNPWSYHIVNIFLHFLVGGILYFLFKFFLNRQNYQKRDFLGLGVITVLLFLSHPLNTEAVNYISSRSDLMVTLFISSGFLNYLKKRHTFFLICYISALLTKETGLCLPLLVLAYDFIFNVQALRLPYLLKDIWGKKERKICYIAVIVITLSYLIYKNTVFKPVFSVPLRSYYSNILIQSAVTFFYLKLFLFPYPLSIFHYFPNLNTIFTPLAFLSAAGVILLASLVFFFRRRNPLLSFGIAWYLICLLPKFYARLQFTACEHHFYLPSIGVYLVLLVLLRKLYLVYRRYFTYAAAGLIAVFTILVWFRNYEYQDILKFWEIERIKEPKSAAVYLVLGTEYMKRKELDKAKEVLEKAANLAVDNSQLKEYWFIKVNLASIYFFEGRLDESLAIINKAVKVLPYYYIPYQILGDIYERQGKDIEAQKAWDKSLYYNPYFSAGYDRLVNFYLEKQDLQKVQYYADKAVRNRAAGYLPYFALGYVYEMRGRSDTAVKLYQQSIVLDSGYFYSHYHLGTLYAKEGNRLALEELKKAVDLDPQAAFAYNDLAVAYTVVNPPDWKSAQEYALKAKALGYPVKEDFLEFIKKNL